MHAQIEPSKNNNNTAVHSSFELNQENYNKFSVLNKIEK